MIRRSVPQKYFKPSSSIFQRAQDVDKLELKLRALRAQGNENTRVPRASGPNRMSETKHEIAQIREITHEVGRFGGIMRLLFVAERTTHEGTETIAMSNEFEWQKDKKLSDEELERASRKLHNMVLKSLLSEGWEPIGTDEKGRVMALRRTIAGEEPGEPVENSEPTEPDENLSWGITAPWRREQKTPSS